ncbi:MAG: bifunctional hydroxymethylpyrimidine kinase/phosphomethylpyrimidine kinase [Roseimicrobium sp.]
MVPPILTIAGSDCSAGAGVQADLKTITALGGYALTALTSVVAEVPAKVSRIQLLDAEMVMEQIRVLAAAFPIAAAKTGMLGGVAQIEAIAAIWPLVARGRVPLVVDPVMVATSGKRLLDENAGYALTERLFPLARLITPNMDEAAALLGRTMAKTRDEMQAAAEKLQARFGCACLLKGGHFGGETAPDILVDGTHIEWFEGQRIPGVHTHGTGCTLSAAIATGLGMRLPMREAVAQAKEFVAQAIARHFRWGTVDALRHERPGNSAWNEGSAPL